MSHKDMWSESSVGIPLFLFLRIPFGGFLLPFHNLALLSGAETFHH